MAPICKQPWKGPSWIGLTPMLSFIINNKEVQTKFNITNSVSEWIGGWVGVRVSEWVGRWVGEWMSEWVSGCIYDSQDLQAYTLSHRGEWPSGLRRYDQNRNIPGLNPRRLPARTSRLLVGRRGVIGHSQLNPTSRPSTHPPIRNCGLEINDPPPHAKMRKDHIS